MALTDITKAAFSATETVVTEVRGWDVVITKDADGYHTSIFLAVEPDDSDKSVIVADDCLPNVACVREFIKEELDYLAHTPKAVLKAAQARDFGEINVRELMA